MDLQTDYSFDEQNVLLVPSVDPLVFNTFDAVHGSFDTIEQQFNAVNNSFAAVDDTLHLLTNPCDNDHHIISNDQMSSRTSFAAHEINFTTEDTTAHWSVDTLPLFPDLILVPDIVSVDEIDTLIPMTNELQQASEPEQILMTKELQLLTEPEQIPITDKLQLSSEPEHILMTDELRLSAEPEQVLITGKLQLSSEPDIVSVDEIDTLIPMTNELQQASEPEQILMTDELRLSAEPEQILMTKELRLSAEPEQILITDKLQLSSESEKLPSIELLTKPSKFKHTRIPHTYNTRMMAYKNSISEFIVKDQEMLDRMRKNQQRPTPCDGSSTPHNQWLHSKNWLHVNLLRFDVPLKRKINYSQSRSYKTKRGRFKNAPVTSATSSTTSSITISKMGCAKEKFNQKHDSAI